MKTATVIKIQIKGSSKQAQLESPEETANYLTTYYKSIIKNTSPLKWRFVKAMGDGVLITAEENNSSDIINRIYKTISEKYNIELQYRICNFIEKKFKFNSYSCLDIIGKDINNLFLSDSATIKLG
jgi:hypothetical protein